MDDFSGSYKSMPGVAERNVVRGCSSGKEGDREVML
jgi:hypothetical protein